MDFPNRKLPRLKGYDYARSAGYFITICTAEHQHLLSRIAVGSDPQIAPSPEGRKSMHFVLRTRSDLGIAPYEKSAKE